MITSNSSNAEKESECSSLDATVYKEEGGHCSTEHLQDENSSYLQVDENAGPFQIPEVLRVIKFHLHNPWIVYEMTGHTTGTK